MYLNKSGKKIYNLITKSKKIIRGMYKVLMEFFRWSKEREINFVCGGKEETSVGVGGCQGKVASGGFLKGRNAGSGLVEIRGWRSREEKPYNRHLFLFHS